ncbi:MAG: ZIP family metal transporter, partial [Candidatus Micrarchaeota archaeon]
TYLSLIGDGLHNLIDGLVIGASYVADVRLGFATTFVIIAHEVPQELGDFAILVYGGFSKARALAYNFLTALTAVLGALIGYSLSSQVDSFSALLLPFTAGGFIYIASSDLVPELHKEPDIKKSAGSFLIFILGVALMLVMKMIAE